MKKIILFVLFLGISSYGISQKLVVHHLDDNGKETKVETYKHGDFIVIAHAKEGKKVHYFEGKITGLYKNKGVIKVLDLARTTRVMSIVGKKLEIDEIVGVARPDTKEMKKRENNAVGAMVAGAIGAGIGGSTGNAIMSGAEGESIAVDFFSREKVGKQNIKCELVK